MDPAEVKVLIAKITGLPVAAIPDDHHEVSPRHSLQGSSPSNVGLGRGVGRSDENTP